MTDLAHLNKINAFFVLTSPQGISGRCNAEVPQRDAFNRAVLQDCRDTNAATFHLALTNLIGLQNKGFVMDVFLNNEASLLCTVPRAPIVSRPCF